MKIKVTTRRPCGFSLSEMLLALLAMVVITALIVPLFLFSNDFQEVNERRNAQMLAAVSYRAHEAGVDFVEGAEVGTALQNLLAGGETSKGQRFQARGLSVNDAKQAAQYLKVQDGHLIYQPNSP